MAKIRKAVGALLGGITGGAIVTALGLFDITIGAELAAAIALILATVGTYVAPKNEEA